MRSINPQPGDVLVEVGPGEGALTRPLLECVPRMDAIEIDRDLAARLAAEFPPSRLTLHVADVLEFDFSVFPEGMRVVGNLPYNISTPMLFHLARYAARVRDMHFMLQLEVVERMVAKHSTKAVRAAVGDAADEVSDGQAVSRPGGGFHAAAESGVRGGAAGAAFRAGVRGGR